jgi:hypothetical protein
MLDNDKIYLVPLNKELINIFTALSLHLIERVIYLK